MIDFNIIGFGRLGHALTQDLQLNNIGTLVGICTSTYEGAQRAVQSLGTGSAFEKPWQLPKASLTFICTPDDAIAEVAKALAKSKVLDNTIVIHLSGALDSNVLAPLTHKRAFVGSLHPLQSFTQTVKPNAFVDCLCAFEGDLTAKSVVVPLFEALGASIFSVNSAKKAQYHAAAVFASNYVVTLAKASQALLEDAQIESDIAKQITQNLIQTSLSNIKTQKSLKQALTGPLQRGDQACIQKHLEALKAFPAFLSLYKTAALNTLDLTLLTPKELDYFQQLLGS